MASSQSALRQTRLQRPGVPLLVPGVQANPDVGHGAGVARPLATLAHGAYAGRLPSGQLFLQHGPVNLVVFVDADAKTVHMAEDSLMATFPYWLGALVAELPLLRTQVSELDQPLRSEIGCAMLAAAAPFADEFVTPMAAVAGAIADAAVATIGRVPNVRRAFVNNGGDIALFLADGTSLEIGLATTDKVAAEAATSDTHGVVGTLTVDASSSIRGIATSGWRGRSMSLGVADAVTVLATTAARADAAATVIASATDVETTAATRVPANTLDDDSDLGERLVTQQVGKLQTEECRAALSAGKKLAQAAYARGHILGATLHVQSEWAAVGTPTTPLSGALSHPQCKENFS